MLDDKPNIVLSNQEYNVVGKRPIRHDGAEKVTGQARYGADVNLPGMLHGKILRSPHTHARIKSINTAHAEELPGVHGIITSADLAQPSGKLVDLAEGMLHNMRFLSNNIMADDKVLYKGHAIAAVAATSPHIAEEALKLIQVEYDVLPPVRNAVGVHHRHRARRPGIVAPKSTGHTTAAIGALERRVVVRMVDRRLHGLFEPDLWPNRPRRGARAFLRTVEQAEFQGINAELFAQHIDRRFHGKSRRRDTGGPIRG